MLAHTPVNVPGFLFGTLRNKMRRVLAARLREVATEDPAAAEPSPDDALATLLRREDGDHVARLLDRVCNPLEQEVMAMVLEDHDGPEIAKALEITPGHVRVLRHRTLDKLRRALEEAAS